MIDHYTTVEEHVLSDEVVATPFNIYQPLFGLDCNTFDHSCNFPLL
jgi:hypothetical protein